MSLPLERWARQAVLLERKGDFTPVASRRIWDDINDAKMLQRQTWKERQRRLIMSGEPLMMPEGTYGGLLAYPPPATITTTSISGTVNLWPQLQYSPIPINGILAPQAYRLAVCAKITTSTSPGNIGFAPFIGATGAWTTGGTSLATGVALGATGNVALTASITNAFYYIVGDLTIRTVGLPGTNTTAVGMFHAVSTQATSGGLAGPAVVGTGMNLLFGGTNASFDNSVASGLAFGAVHTVTTITHNVEQLHFMDWN